MCGIAGILRTWGAGQTPPTPMEAIPESWLDILDESIKHRGPDGCGRFRQRATRADGTTVDVALVHRRMSVIDLEGGAQPMVIGTGEAILSREGLPYGPAQAHACPKCGTGMIAVVFNGCIYNHRELRRELEAAGHEFFTDHSDTEILLHGWREWGSLLLERLDGMCAAAVWDAEHSALYFLRTRFGEKPLYEFAHTGSRPESYAVGSTIPGLARLSRCLDGDLGLDMSGVQEWLAMGWSPTSTPFEGLRQVPAPGMGTAPWGMKHTPWLQTRPASAARPAKQKVRPFRSTADVEEHLALAVESRLEADVPLGCFLSGGVDSSLVAHFARQRLGSLSTLSVRMPDARYDESAIAVRAAGEIGTDHHTLECDPRPAEDLASLIAQLGLPFGDSSLLPTHWISRAARPLARVVLTGDGGDEMFCGYERHRVDETLQRLRFLGLALRMVPQTILSSRDPKSTRSKAGRLVTALAHRGYQDLVAIFPAPDHRALAGRRAGCRYHTDHGRAYDAAHYLPGDLMRKSDTASMAVSLEARSPFLATGLADAALATPLSMLMPRGQRKGLLRAVARRYLPAEIVDRPKMGFALPIGEWFRTDYGGMRQLLHDHLESADPFPGLAEAGVELNMDFVRRMMREHDAAGERSVNPWHGRDHSQRLYMLVVLSIWCRWLKGL